MPRTTDRNPSLLARNHFVPQDLYPRHQAWYETWDASTTPVNPFGRNPICMLCGMEAPVCLSSVPLWVISTVSSGHQTWDWMINSRKATLVKTPSFVYLTPVRGGGYPFTERRYDQSQLPLITGFNSYGTKETSRIRTDIHTLSTAITRKVGAKRIRGRGDAKVMYSNLKQN